MKHPLALIVLLAALVLLPSCGDPAPRQATVPDPAHVLLADADEVVMDATGAGALAQPLLDAFGALDVALAKEPALQEIVVVQPGEGETLTGDDRAPRFLWRDPADGADTWHVAVRFGAPSHTDLRLFVLGGMPAESALDPFASTLHAWTPSPAVWAALVEQAADAPVVVTFVGFAADAPGTPLTRGSVTMKVAKAR